MSIFYVDLSIFSNLWDFNEDGVFSGLKNYANAFAQKKPKLNFYFLKPIFETIITGGGKSTDNSSLH